MSYVKGIVPWSAVLIKGTQAKQTPTSFFQVLPELFLVEMGFAACRRRHLAGNAYDGDPTFWQRHGYRFVQMVGWLGSTWRRMWGRTTCFQMLLKRLLSVEHKSVVDVIDSRSSDDNPTIQARTCDSGRLRFCNDSSKVF